MNQNSKKFQCKFCKNKFNTKSNLVGHQRTAKYCLKIQGKIDETIFKCEGCQKILSSDKSLKYHKQRCIHVKEQYTVSIYEEKMTILSTRKDKTILNLKSSLLKHKTKYEKDLDKLETTNKEIKQDYQELLDAYQRLAELYVMDGKNKIEGLNKKFLKKRGRTKYEDQNVIYILTTPGLKKERRYILGKATNLTNRLSTYNKTDEHEVVFYSSCPNKEKMSLVEGMVFDKLEVYREQANRERFILPVDRKIDLFSGTIKKCIDFVK